VGVVDWSKHMQKQYRCKMMRRREAVLAAVAVAACRAGKRKAADPAGWCTKATSALQ
jgi:hypothetical protein